MNPESTLRAEFEKRLRLETLIADLSSPFVNLPPGEVDRDPMHADVDVANHHNYIGISRWNCAGAKFQMQVRQNVDFHRVKLF
jgi:hypothetical protein